MTLINNRISEKIEFIDNNDHKYFKIYDLNIDGIIINESQFSKDVTLYIKDNILFISYVNHDINTYTLYNKYIDIDKMNNYIIINVKDMEPDMETKQSYPIVYLDINNSFNSYNIKIQYKIDKFNTVTLLSKSYDINNYKDIENYSNDLKKYYKLIQDKERVDKLYKIYNEDNKYLVLFNGFLYEIVWKSVAGTLCLSTLKNDVYEQSISITLDELLLNNQSTKLISKKRIIIYNDCIIKNPNTQMRQIQESEQKYYNFRNTELYKLFKLNQHINMVLDLGGDDGIIENLCKDCMSLIMKIYDDDVISEYLQYFGIVYILNGVCFEFTKESIDKLLQFSKDILNDIEMKYKDDIDVL